MSDTHQYLIALGSNMRHPQDGPPRAVLRAAIETLEDLGLHFYAVSPIIDSAPVGPSQRRFANAAAHIETKRDPQNLLGVLKALEEHVGRKRRGQRWRARVLDLDIILWSGGCWSSESLTIPHPAMRERHFVLGPASAIAPRWRDPISRLSLRQLNARLTRARTLPR